LLLVTQPYRSSRTDEMTVVAIGLFQTRLNCNRWNEY